MPNKANLRRWVSALRSGQYQQGQSYMRSEDNKYCCLGVAMDLAIANGVVCKPDWGKTSITPSAVNDWFGVRGSGGLNDHLNHLNRVGHSPANMNDVGISFAEIADKIEAHYRLLED